MTHQAPTPERLAAFSDGVFAVIITIMVLELKVPHESNLHALAELAHTFCAYALSYLFVGMIWINHHHLIRHTERAVLNVLYANLGLLFFVSLIPFFTAYVAEKQDAFTTALYAGIFLLVTSSFMLFQKVVGMQFGSDEELIAMNRAGSRRNWIAFAAYAIAVPAAYIHTWVSLAIIVGVSMMYLVPIAVKAPRPARQ